MRTLLTLVALFASSCGPSVFTRVSKARTLEQARLELRGEEPTITPYPPNAEAWYFGKNECVLFVDGVIRVTKTSAKKQNDQSVPDWKQNQVLCTPSDVTP